MTLHYTDAFNVCVRRRWGRFSSDVQRTANNNGRMRRGQLSLHESEPDALSDVISFQKMHMTTFQRLLASCNDQGLISVDDLMRTQNIAVVDFGAGAATVGIAINAQWANYLSSFDYFPIEPHPAMQSIGTCLLKNLSTPRTPAFCLTCNLRIPQQLINEPYPQNCPHCEVVLPQEVGWQWPVHGYMKNLRQLENTNFEALITADRLFFTFSYLFQQNALLPVDVQNIVELISSLKTRCSADKTIEILATGARTKQLYNHMDQFLLKFDELRIMYDMKELSLTNDSSWKRYVRIDCD